MPISPCGRLALSSLVTTYNHYDQHLQVSATLLGEPDVGLLTPPEMARKTSQICMSIPQIPVIVDADTGEALDNVGIDTSVSWSIKIACCGKSSYMTQVVVMC